MTRTLDRLLHRLYMLLAFGAGHRPEPLEPTSAHPGDTVRRNPRVVALSIAIALSLPLAFGVALIPLRGALEQSISLLMVVPVLVVAAVGGTRLAALAAVAAALTFAIVHTEPYYEITVDDADDIVEIVVLLLIGVLAGLIIDAAQRSIASARARARELAAMTAFVDEIGDANPADLVARAQRSIEEMLVARSSTWRPGYRGTSAPVLRPSGMISPSGYADTREIATTRLPRELEIPVGTPPNEHGRFVVRCSDADVSLEERRAAATIAAALGRSLGAP